MKQADKRKQRQAGFTLMEVLVTVAIIICLLALSFVAITKYIRHIQITELDTAAREIYMAAQNQAILLSSSGELESCVIKTANNDAGGTGTGVGGVETGGTGDIGETGSGTGESAGGGTGTGGTPAVTAQNQMEHVEVTPNAEGTPQITAYYIASDDSAIAKLLPETSIESDLWNDKFYIVYEPVSGSVIDVFYAKDETVFGQEGDFPSFYNKWRAAPKEDRMNNKPMIGYYGGDSAESGNSLSLRTPVVNIYNEDVLRAEVTYWIPRILYTINSGNSEIPKGGIHLDVTLSYDGKKIPLELESAEKPEEPETIEYIPVTYIFKLDSMEEGKQFRDLLESAKDIDGNKINASDMTMGKDFTITAEVSYDGKETGMQVNGATKSATDNSLFAKGSGEETAKIAYMRHLQNLDADFSGVKGKTAAKQIADITCDSKRSFIPVENKALTSYDGGKFHIKELHVDADETPTDYSKSAYGLFGEVSGMTLSNIKMVNAQVNGRSNPTGTLVGSGSNMKIEDCGIYWENTSASDTTLRYVLGDSEQGIEYKVQGGTVGGLAGQLFGSTITGSFAATTIEGTGENGTAGGLVGKTSGSLKIESSYADNYLKGKHAAGLIGNLNGGCEATITDSYAAGFIKSEKNDEAAGFCLGKGTVKATRAYSAMLFSETAKNYALSEKKGNYVKTYYLDSAFITQKGNGTAKSYADLTDAKKIDNLYGTGHKFEMKTTQTTFPYNLQTTLNLTRYSYPGLKDVDHYGDWGAEFQNGSLVYYERYDTGDMNYAFNGGDLDLISNEHYAIEDGYALAFLSTGNLAQTGMTIKVTYKKDQGPPVTATLEYGKDEIKKITHTNPLNGKTEEYFLLTLPGELGGEVNIVNTNYAATNFYQEITFSQVGGDKVTGHYYYNPHFANAVLEYEDGMNLEQEARKVTAEIRTARHLYMLSKHEEYFSSSHPYKFKQEMNIDYSIYQGYDLFKKNKNGIRVCFQTPIGNGDKPFKGTYDGDCHTIENVGVDSGNKRYIGLFGYSQGTIKNAAYLINQHTVGTIISQRTSGTVYIGGLAGYNGGIIQNCAVAGMEINGYAYDFSTVRAGGLVGWNRGTIRNSSAALTNLTVETTLSNSYVGGFVGRNGEGGDIKKCYAVGRVEVEKSRYGDVVACGFAGTNKGTITKSYAAVDLQTSGGAKACGFCQDETSKSNYYMNEGNFIYNDVNYTAQYDDTLIGDEAADKATAKKWSDFTNVDSGLHSSLEMSVPGETKSHEYKDIPDKMYPYPGVVKDSKENYIHYGMWPEMMNLNQGGIYYWEKMEGINDSPSYHLSAIVVDLNTKTVEKIDTLSNKHGDGGIVTEYGYGYLTPAITDDAYEVSLESKGVDYDGYASLDKWEENTACNEELEKLLENKYEFHSYNTWDTDKANNKGLYLTSETEPYGTWTLNFKDGTESENKIDFNINPFFADSMTLKSELAVDWTVDVPSGIPGETAQTSFQVRSADQLQFINWNVEKNTNTVLNKGNGSKFLFLGYSKLNDGGNITGCVLRPYFWKQTHDLQGEKGKTYTPIAELYDDTSGQGAQRGTLFGWFGGTYDGDDYVIQDVNVKGQTSSCTGLFGMVYDGTLKNIIMYSPTGKGKIIAGATSEGGDNTKGSAWCAIGGLAGFVATNPDNPNNEDSAIENCSIAGYTIEDEHIGISDGAWGGTNMGGLIGVSSLDLKNCTAVTNLNSKVKDNDNVRIGGLVGSCQESISSCYAGGEINVDGAIAGQKHGIYVGGIVGGVYFKPLNGPNGLIGEKWINGTIVLTNEIRNCYSYVTLPNVTADGAYGRRHVTALYAIGGPGELWSKNYSPMTEQDISGRGYTTYENCYYLKNVVWSNNGGKAPTDKVRCDTLLQHIDDKEQPAWPSSQNSQWWYKEPYKNPQVHDLSYAQMSSKEPINEVDNKLLIDALESAGFETVTTKTAGGNIINGKYSFTSDPALIGENYPFPTILTQKDKGSQPVNVHYGAWPVEGLKRGSGSVPIDIDLFADYDSVKGKAIKEEQIVLSSLVETGGTLKWEVLDEEGKPLEGDDKKIVEAEIDADAFKGNQRTTPLTLIGKQAGSAKVKVTYTTAEGKEYTIIVDVRITAELQVLPETRPISMFTEETASVVLNVKDKNGQLIEEKGGTLLNDIKLEPQNFTVELDSDYLSDPKVTKDGDKLLLSMTSHTDDGITKATLNYSYTYNGEKYTGTNPVSVEIDKPSITLDPLEIYLDGGETKVVEYGEADGIEEKIGLEVAGKKPDSITIIGFENGEDRTTVFAEWQDESQGILKIEGYKPNGSMEAGMGYIYLKLRFTVDGVIHEIQQTLEVKVYPGSKPETP